LNYHASIFFSATAFLRPINLPLAVKYSDQFIMFLFLVLVLQIYEE